VTLLPADQVPAIRPSAPRTAPSLGRAPDARFPRVEHGTLRNGITVAYAHDPNAPMTRLLVSFDGGLAAEGEAYGIQRLTLNAMLASSEGMDTAEVGRAKERLGASIETVVKSDASSIVIQAPSGGLLPTMELLSDLLQRPAFPDADVERLREEQLADIGQEVSNPTRAAQRVMAEAIGRGTPYQSYSDLGSRGSVSSFTAADLRAFRTSWYQPGATRIFVISDLPFAVVHDRIDAQLGDWRSSAVPGRVLSSQGRPPVGRVLLIDRPGAPQTSVVLGIPTTMRGDGDLVALLMADEALGESGTSRINLDIRETNNWSYGARGGFQLNRTFVPYVLRAAVQADRTGDVMDAMRRHVSAFTTTEPMTQAEFEFVIESTIRKLPGKYETPMSRLYAMQSNTLAGRPDTYVADLAARYRALRLPDLQKAISDALDLEKAFWVVTGDASVIEPQIRLLGLPVEAITPNE
jgi:predicted Zn-dependent peptidase